MLRTPYESVHSQLSSLFILMMDVFRYFSIIRHNRHIRKIWSDLQGAMTDCAHCNIIIIYSLWNNAIVTCTTAVGTYFIRYVMIFFFNQQVARLRENERVARGAGEWNRCRRASRLSLTPERPAARRVNVARASHRSPSNPETRCRSADTRRHRFRRHAAAAEPVSVSPPSPEPGSRQTHAASAAHPILHRSSRHHDYTAHTASSECNGEPVFIL